MALKFLQAVPVIVIISILAFLLLSLLKFQGHDAYQSNLLRVAIGPSIKPQVPKLQHAGIIVLAL